MKRRLRKIDCPVENNNGSPVIKDWVTKLSWKMQAVLIQGLREPDTHYCEHIKDVSRWMRSLVMKNADKGHTFMCTQRILLTEGLEHELNYCSMHFTTHFLYAIEIIKYKHPEKEVRRIASNYYRGVVVEICHFDIETEKSLDVRLSDVDKEEEEITECPAREDDPYLRGVNW